MVNDSIIECKNVSKRFGIQQVVNQVNFGLAQGQILSILGPSGSGKTTLLRLIAGFERISEGEIKILDQIVSEQGLFIPPEKRHLGMVFQEYALFPHLNVARNVVFGLSGMSSQDRDTRLHEMLDLVKLPGFADRYPAELSGGQQQRIALARTLATSPIGVLLDEPFSSVDATMRTELRNDVNQILRDSNISAIFVTHDREEAFAMADRIAVMIDGQIQQIDSPDNLYHSPVSREVAGMAGSCDFITGIVNTGYVETELGKLSLNPLDSKHKDGTKVDVLIRLDDFQVAPDLKGKGTIVSRELRGDEVVLLVKTDKGENLRCRRHHYSSLPEGTKVRLFTVRPNPFVVFPQE